MLTARCLQQERHTEADDEEENIRWKSPTGFAAGTGTHSLSVFVVVGRIATTL